MMLSPHLVVVNDGEMIEGFVPQIATCVFRLIGLNPDSWVTTHLKVNDIVPDSILASTGRVLSVVKRV